MPSTRKYPRKGEYGDSTPRCEWCGIRVYNLSPFRDRSRRVWCSSECSAAGNYFQNIAIMIGSFVILVVFVVVAVHPSGFLQSEGITEEGVQFTMLFPVVLLVIMAVAGYYVRLGFRVRAGPREEKPLKSEVEFTELHHKIIEFLKEFPANEGVAKKDVYRYLNVKNASPNQINMAIIELVGSGYIQELRRFGYIKLIEKPQTTSRVDSAEYEIG